MILQLRRLFERPEDRLDIHSSVSLEELGDLGTSCEFAAPLSLDGSVKNLAGMVTLDYTLEAKVLHVCDRCLREFTKDYKITASHIIVRDEASLTGEDDVLCEDGDLDMSELAVSDLLIALPTKILCREDCKGLCPVCGKDLNDGDCGCNKEE